jgi:hypothetical protein
MNMLRMSDHVQVQDARDVHSVKRQSSEEPPRRKLIILRRPCRSRHLARQDCLSYSLFFVFHALLAYLRHEKIDPERQCWFPKPNFEFYNLVFYTYVAGYTEAV